jgi:hypothetical protein
VRLWFKFWRWFIVPATVLTAANPFAIWYEKTLMGEANFLFFTLVLALAATLWVKHPGKYTFAFLLLGMFLEAGTRGEAKLFFAVGIILVPLILWRHWKKMLIHFAIVIVVMLGAFRISETSHAPSLLYATLVHLTPDHLRFEPGIEPYVLPLRDHYRAEWIEHQSELVQAAKVINKTIEPYLKKKYPAKSVRTAAAGVMMVPFQKFQQAVDGWSSGIFDENYLHKEQEQAATRGKWMTEVLSKGLTGHQLNEDEMKAWIESHYDAPRLRWFSSYQAAWNAAMIYFRAPDRPVSQPRWVHDYVAGIPAGLSAAPGLTLFYIVAGAGMFAAMLRPSQLGVAQIGWVSGMLFVWWSATLVGVTNARFRFVYEPFCIIYTLLFFDCLCDWSSRLIGSKTVRTSENSAVCISS